MKPRLIRLLLLVHCVQIDWIFSACAAKRKIPCTHKPVVSRLREEATDGSVVKHRSPTSTECCQNTVVLCMLPSWSSSKSSLVAGTGRYGQELGNIAAQALKQTNMLKKKCNNRTNKTMRQLRTACDANCEAAEKAIEATRAAEKAVQNLASFAGKLCVPTDSLAVKALLCRSLV